MKNLITTVMFFLIASFAIAQGSLDSALVAYYPFNGNSNDETGNGHNGTVNGGILTYDRFNQQDNAYTFPNLHNNIVLDNTIGMNLETGFTLNAWVKYKNINCGIVGKHNCWVVNGFYLGIDNGHFWFRLANSVWSDIVTNEVYVEDQWYMVTGVYDQITSTGKVYVNGVLKASGSVLYNNYSSAPITISEASNGCPDGNMPGAIDEVKIYNRTLSDAEILEQYNLSNTDLIAYYPFNGNANDESGNNINPSYIGSGVTLTSDRFGLNNRAFYFDGNDGSYIRIPADSLPTTSRTISLWINASDLSGGKVPFSYGGNGCNTSSFIMVMNLFGNSAYNVTGHCNQSFISSAYSAPPINTWKHWVITIEGATQKLYIDGVLKQTEYNYVGSSYVAGRSAIIGGLIYTDGTTVYVDPNAGYFKGKIDDIRIYNHAIIDQQVVELYNDLTTYTPPTLEDGLAMFLPFNGNANDESGNGNNGTVNGANLTQDRFGVNGGAYSFDGIDDYITIADNPNLFSDSLTISWWYNISQYDDAGAVIGWIEGGSRYQQFFNGTAFSYFNAYRSDPLSIINPIYTLTNLNEWVNVSVTYKKNNQTSSTTSLFINGEHKQTDIHYMSMEYLPGHNFYIGQNHTPGVEFYGKLDDFRIYNRVLNENEILALYNDSTTYYPQLISEVYPLPNSNNCQYNESIKVYFSEPMNEATFNYNSISTHGNLTGSYELIFTYQSSTNTLEIQPTVPFKYGEQITVTLDSSIQSVSGYNLSPYVFQFNVKPEIGSAKFAIADSFQLNFPPTNIVSGDFNNDGKVDVIVSNYDSSKYTILLNNGSGGFILGEELAGPFKPYSISFTDIDNDRDLDMIVSTNEQNQIRVLRGTGQGIFGWILPYIDVNAPVATCPGDFDGDGDNDFVALCNTGNAIFYKNDGAGVFTPSGSTTINVPAGIRNIVGDIDNDGDLDIIGGTGDYWGVFKILKNDGSGNFSFVGGPYLGPHPDELAGGDFDGDYDLDFIKCDWYQNGVGIGLNNSLGVFDNFLNLGGTGTYPRNPVVNDFDADGDLDAAFRTMGSWPSLIPVITILKNYGSLNFTQDNTYPITGANGVTAADFDNNGSVDLVGISNTTNQVKFLKNCVDSLVAYWPFDGNILDNSGNLNHSISDIYSFTTDRYGNPQSAKAPCYLEGGNAGNNLPEGSSARSISCWINSTEQIGNNAIFDYGYAANSNSHFALYLWDGKYASAGNENDYILSDKNIGDDTWNFITSVYEGGLSDILGIYINGKLDTAATISDQLNTELTTRWSIGGFMSTGTLNASIDELKVYNFALTHQQIWDMYKATTTAPNLIYPGNDSTLINPQTLVLDWDSTVTATSYRLVISNDSLFNTIAYDTILTITSFNFDDWTAINFDNINWKVRTINDGGIGPWSETNRFNIILTDVENEQQLPKEFALMQNYPNPFNPSTTITYHLPKTAKVELKIYDVLGTEIATLANEEKPAGIYHIEFNLASGIRNLASGIFFYQLKAGEFVQTRKMNFIK